MRNFEKLLALDDCLSLFVMIIGMNLAVSFCLGREYCFWLCDVFWLESIGERGLKVSSNNYTKLGQSCADLNCVEMGRRFHGRLSVVETKLVSVLAKCGCLGDARKVFDGMPERNLFTWSVMIGGREQVVIPVSSWTCSASC